MRNSEKYKTPHEQVEAFLKAWKCEKYSAADFTMHEFLKWLNLEAEEEKLLPCPFCGGELKYPYNDMMGEQTKYRLVCECGYATKAFDTVVSVISAHNRVAKKCREEKE